MKRTVHLSSLLIPVLLAGLLISPAFAQEPERWDLLTVKELGVDRFLAAHPDWNGSKVVVAVLDTGVDMGVKGLEKLPDGGVKVVDVRDFTGEGDLFWKEARLAPEGKGAKLVDPEGRSLKGFEKFTEDADPERFFLAFLEESKFSDTAVRDLNGDGDTKDVFGFLVFSVRVKEKEEKKEEENEGGGNGKAVKEGGKEAGKKKEAEQKEEGPGELRYVAVVDLNGDGNLDDGVRLTDYWRKHETFTLRGKKGDRRKLTMALNFYPAEQRLSVHFDDGGHGTHVAGIAAGYRIHGQEGYNGMAPGARVISLKIGNNHFAGGATVTESVKKALDYAAKYAKEHKTPVVCNMSFGIMSEREGKSAIDKYVDDLLWKHPGVVFVNSAGNDGPGLSSVGTPAAGMRAVTVGALLSPAAAAAQYGAKMDHEVLFSFSSRGGELFKPDIVAPGSAASTVPPWGDRDHMNGTSMASPAAAGAVALLVDGLRHHDPPYPIDNALILRAVKNTGRHVKGLTVLDEGGGAIDLPAAYAYAAFLCGQKEQDTLREYRVSNRGPAGGVDTAYWRTAPALPRPNEADTFVVRAGFKDKITAEAKARFYRAFDLEPDAEWLTLTKPLVYLKGGVPANVGLMADLTGKPPGLYTARVRAFRKGPERIEGKRIHAFDLVYSVAVPFRITPENRGVIRTAGSLRPGDLRRVFVEVPPGITALHMRLRMLEGGRSARVSAALFDPWGVERGGTGADDRQRPEGEFLARGDYLVPGTWEIVVNSSIRSMAPAKYDLEAALAGVELGDPLRFDGDGITKERLGLPVRCTQPRTFSGRVEGRIDGFMRRERVTVEKGDLFTRIVTLDDTVRSARFRVDFDRDTYALFTDCVFRIEDPETGKAIQNSGLNYRSGTVAVMVPTSAKEPKQYKLVLRPAFTAEKDAKGWRFTLTTRLGFASGPLKIEPVVLQGRGITLAPWEFTEVEFRLPGPPPAAPEGYRLDGVFEASSNADGLIARKHVEL